MKTRAVCALRVLAVLGLGLAPLTAAHAILKFEPYLSTEAEYDSNVRRVNDADAGPRGKDDRLQTYRGGFDARYRAGLQSLALDGEVYRVEYDTFSEYDYDGHELGGALDWRVGSRVRGDLQLRTARQAEDFSSRLRDNRRSLVDSDTGSMSAALRVLRDFELRPRLSARRVRYSLEASERQDLDEEAVALGVVYVGPGTLSIGVEGEVTRGDFVERQPGAGVIEESEQFTLGLIAGWKPSVITELSLLLGASRRDNQGRDVEDGSDEIIGRLDLKRSVSVKTSLYASLYRNVANALDQGESTVVRSGLNVGGHWRATPTLDVNVSALVQREDFQDSLFADGRDRADDLTQFTFKLDYRPRKWLSLGPTAAWQERTSNVDSAEYDAYQLGLALTLRWPSRVP